MENAPIAFAVVSLAGLSTMLGATVVFIPWLHKYASRKILAVSLAFASGVMVYISLVDIFPKATAGFGAAGVSEKYCGALASVCLFAGMAALLGLNKIVELAVGDVHPHDHGKQQRDKQRSTRLTRTATEESLEDLPSLRLTPFMCDVDVVDELKSMNERERERQEFIELEQKAREIGIDTWDDVAIEETKGTTSNPSDPEQPLVDEPLVDEPLVDEPLVDEPPVDQPPVDQPPVEQASTARTNHHTAGRSNSKERMQSKRRLQRKKRSQSNDRLKSSKKRRNDELAAQDRQEKKQLEQMGLKTAVAIMLHNFPEGLATFVTALAEPKVGFVLAVAIALHNIPEGLCVALPIYYATQNRCKAFAWALLSGLSEPLAALLGWLVLVNIYNHAVSAVVFGIVSGMMIIIPIRELLPTALRYDPDNDFVTLAFIVGMFVMSLSLVVAKL